MTNIKANSINKYTSDANYRFLTVMPCLYNQHHWTKQTARSYLQNKLKLWQMLWTPGMAITVELEYFAVIMFELSSCCFLHSLPLQSNNDNSSCSRGEAASDVFSASAADVVVSIGNASLVTTTELAVDWGWSSICDEDGWTVSHNIWSTLHGQSVTIYQYTVATF